MFGTGVRSEGPLHIKHSNIFYRSNSLNGHHRWPAIGDTFINIQKMCCRGQTEGMAEYIDSTKKKKENGDGKKSDLDVQKIGKH